MMARLNTTLGLMLHAAQPSVATIMPYQGQGYPPPSAKGMGALIGRSIVAVVQTLTPASIACGGVATGSDTTRKDKYSPDEVAALLGLGYADAVHKLPQFWKRIQASTMSQGDASETFCQITMEVMATWAHDTRYGACQCGTKTHIK
jgi:hypothetical protein